MTSDFYFSGFVEIIDAPLIIITVSNKRFAHTVPRFEYIIKFG